MKLKNLLVTVFLTLTLIPIIIVSLLLYKSGFELSKESYSKNLAESINVQSDFISQTIQNDILSDDRFANSEDVITSLEKSLSDGKSAELMDSFESYLETSQDKFSSGVLLNRDGKSLYTIGESSVLETIKPQLNDLSNMKQSAVVEFQLKEDSQSLGIVTPIYNSRNSYIGSLVSIYNKSYIFKIISSYYEITDAFTYICGPNGEIINFRGLTDRNKNSNIENVLKKANLTNEGVISKKTNSISVTGYYKNIEQTPWYLAGFIDDELIYSFTNGFVLMYILIILIVCVADIILSFYFSRRMVAPINDLINLMTCYENNLTNCTTMYPEKRSYYETSFLRQKFLDLMRNILLVQHNFEGVYQLYQSNDMEDTNINIDVVQQTIGSNKSSFQELIDNVYFSDTDCIVQRFTRCFCKKDQDLLMDIFTKMRDEHLSVTSEADVYTPHLGEKWYHILVVPMYQNDRLSRLFIQLRDISNFKKQEVESFEKARRDALTGLYNRTGFTEVVQEILSKTSAETHGLFFIDMNYFKMVNDNLGHSAGDDLLTSIGTTISNTIGSDGVSSRFGGDEFAVFLPNATAELMEQRKKELTTNLVFPFSTKDFEFEVSASIGMSIWNDDTPVTLEELLCQADSSMYEVKREMKKAH